MPFHRKCNETVSLLNNGNTASRSFVEDHRALLVSEVVLRDDTLFEVRVDYKVKSSDGTMDIGITSVDPESVDINLSALEIENTAWILSGPHVYRDREIVAHNYCEDINTLPEGSKIGVMCSSKGELLFFINGHSLGIACLDVPQRVFPLVDITDKCGQVTIIQPPLYNFSSTDNSVENTEDDPNNDVTQMSELDIELVATPCSKCDDVRVLMPGEGPSFVPDIRDRLRFHPKGGLLVFLTSNNKTAVRQRPLEDYNNGVVMTHRPLYDNEVFTIKIDRLVEKWSGSIEMGVTSHNPATLRFPSTMTNMDSGTVMMSGGKILINGHSTYAEYGTFNLDELRAGDTIGVMRRSTGTLHYFINGIDQGPATEVTAPQVWGVVDLYGMTVQVSIVDPGDDDDHNLYNNQPFSGPQPTTSERQEPRPSSESPTEDDTLAFHSLRDSHVVAINYGKTAHRVNAFEYFKNGMIMTNRPLKNGELFQIRLDLVISKWVGTIEFGVTTYTCNELQTPFRLGTAKSGVWAIIEENFVHNSEVIIPNYIQSLHLLKEGDTLGVLRTQRGTLHFFINCVDQGPAAYNMPESIYGIVDLYGQVAQATIIRGTLTHQQSLSVESPDSSGSNQSINADNMCFHTNHGPVIRFGRTRMTAYRLTVFSPVKQCVIFSSRPLRECEMFEVRIDKTIGSWTGHFEIGLTTFNPDEMDIKDLIIEDLLDTYTLCGNKVMSRGQAIRSDYPLDLGSLTIGSKLGVKWAADRMLHFYLDGIDQGRACTVNSLNAFVVLFLHGQVTQITLIPQGGDYNYNGCISEISVLNPNNFIATPQDPYSFSEYHGDNVGVGNDFIYARRTHLHSNGTLVFSASHLINDEPFEIRIETKESPLSGFLRIGITNIDIMNAHINRRLPKSIAFLPHYTSYIEDGVMKTTSATTTTHNIKIVDRCLEWLTVGDKFGLCRTTDGRVIVSVNGNNTDIEFTDVPAKVYAVFELCGEVSTIKALSGKQAGDSTSKTEPPEPTVVMKESSISLPSMGGGVATTSGLCTTSLDAFIKLSDKLELKREESLPQVLHGPNIRDSNLCNTLTRIDGYDGGVVVFTKPLFRGQSIMYQVAALDNEFESNIMIGGVAELPALPLPVTAVNLPPPCWILADDITYRDRSMLISNLGDILNDVDIGSQVILEFSGVSGALTVHVDDDYVTFATVPEIYDKIYPVVDIYGRCCEINVMSIQDILMESSDSEEERIVITSSSNNDEEDWRNDADDSDLENARSDACPQDDGKKSNDVNCENPQPMSGPHIQRTALHESITFEVDANIPFRASNPWDLRRSHSTYALPVSAGHNLDSMRFGNYEQTYEFNLYNGNEVGPYNMHNEIPSSSELQQDEPSVTEGTFDSNISRNNEYPENDESSEVDSEEIMNALTGANVLPPNWEHYTDNSTDDDVQVIESDEASDNQK